MIPSVMFVDDDIRTLEVFKVVFRVPRPVSWTHCSVKPPLTFHGLPANHVELGVDF